MNHHPQNQTIEKYAMGELSAPLSSMVSAHLEECQECSLKYRDVVVRESAQLESGSFPVAQNELDRAFSAVMAGISEISQEKITSQTLDNVSINISGQVIPLPRSMNFLRDKKIAWKEFGKRNAIAPVVITPEGNFYLIYIGPGESVPQHDHTHAEYSYVVAGSYHDGFSTFETGDFSVSEKGCLHSPKAVSDDGCLVISWVEGRLNYFNGILKPLNSILWWYLHRA